VLFVRRCVLAADRLPRHRSHSLDAFF
jgi:hypothetical protein